MKRKKYITSSKEKRETKSLLKNGYVITLVKMEENSHRPIPCYMGMWGWALLSVIKMQRTIKPVPKMIRTK